MTTRNSKTLTISSNNHFELCKIKLELQEACSNVVRVDFDDVLQYLIALHKKYGNDDLKLYVSTFLEAKANES